MKLFIVGLSIYLSVFAFAGYATGAGNKQFSGKISKISADTIEVTDKQGSSETSRFRGMYEGTQKHPVFSAGNQSFATEGKLMPQTRRGIAAPVW
jgi:hypothetical protein